MVYITSDQLVNAYCSFSGPVLSIFLELKGYKSPLLGFFTHFWFVLICYYLAYPEGERIMEILNRQEKLAAPAESISDIQAKQKRKLSQVELQTLIKGKESTVVDEKDLVLRLNGEQLAELIDSYASDIKKPIIEIQRTRGKETIQDFAALKMGRLMGYSNDYGKRPKLDGSDTKAINEANLVLEAVAFALIDAKYAQTSSRPVITVDLKKGTYEISGSELKKKETEPEHEVRMPILVEAKDSLEDSQMIKKAVALLQKSMAEDEAPRTIEPAKANFQARRDLEKHHDFSETAADTRSQKTVNKIINAEGNSKTLASWDGFKRIFDRYQGQGDLSMSFADMEVGNVDDLLGLGSDFVMPTVPKTREAQVIDYSSLRVLPLQRTFNKFAEYAREKSGTFNRAVIKHLSELRLRLDKIIDNLAGEDYYDITLEQIANGGDTDAKLLVKTIQEFDFEIRNDDKALMNVLALIGASQNKLDMLPDIEKHIRLAHEIGFELDDEESTSIIRVVEKTAREAIENSQDGGFDDSFTEDLANALSIFDEEKVVAALEQTASLDLSERSKSGERNWLLDTDVEEMKLDESKLKSATSPVMYEVKELSATKMQRMPLVTMNLTEGRNPQKIVIKPFVLKDSNENSQIVSQIKSFLENGPNGDLTVRVLQYLDAFADWVAGDIRKEDLSNKEVKFPIASIIRHIRSQECAQGRDGHQRLKPFITSYPVKISADLTPKYLNKLRSSNSETINIASLFGNLRGSIFKASK